jgi:hypothetical protein
MNATAMNPNISNNDININNNNNNHNNNHTNNNIKKILNEGGGSDESHDVFLFLSSLGFFLFFLSRDVVCRSGLFFSAVPSRCWSPSGSGL